MKIAKVSVFAVALTFALGAFADAANVLISFSTRAPSADYAGDTYADGKTVLDGEWYALVWSADGQFAGITTDGKPVREGDAVVLVAPLAKDGHCPYTVFQIDSKSADAHDNGQYAVYLLDTRSADGSTVAAKGADGKPALLNAAKVATSYAAAPATAGGAAEIAASGETKAWGESVVAGDAQPTIVAFKIDGDRVKISVEGIVPGVKYNVQMGDRVDNIKSYALPVPAMADTGKIDFNLEKPAGTFFKVVREPLAK